MNKSEIAGEFQPPPDSASREEIIGALQYWVLRAKKAERAIAESQPQPKIRWRTGKCEQDTRPHLENAYHICHNWRAELGDGEPSPLTQELSFDQHADLLYSRNKWHMLCNGLSLDPAKSAVADVLKAVGGVAQEVSRPLVIEIARELYDRFVMGGWEPKDAYPQIERWLAAIERERDAAVVTLRSMCGDNWQSMGRNFAESLASIEARESRILDLEKEIAALRETK